MGEDFDEEYQSRGRRKGPLLKRRGYLVATGPFPDQTIVSGIKELVRQFFEACKGSCRPVCCTICHCQDSHDATEASPFCRM